MNKREWAGACRRVENRLQNLSKGEQTPAKNSKSKPSALKGGKNGRAHGAKMK